MQTATVMDIRSWNFTFSKIQAGGWLPFEKSTKCHISKPFKMSQQYFAWLHAAICLHNTLPTSRPDTFLTSG